MGAAAMKIEGWETRLAEYLTDAARRPFEYGGANGGLDCVIFASNAVDLQTGIDPMAEGRGRYTDLKTGVALISALRGSYEGIMDFHFTRHDNIARAGRGDVAVRVVDGLKAFGIVGNSGYVFFKADPLGLVKHRVTDCDAAWRIE